MATIDLHIDIFAKRLVTSLTDTTPVRVPTFIQEDTPTLRIWLLQPVTGSTIESPYTYIPVEGVTIELAIGTRVGNSTLYYTQQFTWTPSVDISNPYFEALLPMNTAGITTLLGSSGSASAYLEIKMISGGYPTTVLSEQCTVVAAVIKDGGLEEPALATAMSVESALSTFVPVGNAKFAIWECETDPSVKVRQYLAADGTMHFDPIT